MRIQRLVRLASLARPGLLGMAVLALAGSPAAASDGLLGLFFDRIGSVCSGTVTTGQAKTVYAVLLTSGGTSGGVTGIEFRVDGAAGGGYVLQNAQVASGAFGIGDPLGDGLTAAFGTCQSGPVTFASLQVMNPGSGRGNVQIGIVRRASQTSYTCPTAILCDDPVYTAVCVDGGRLTLNPSAPRPCGPTREDSEWSRVKELYRD
jgi:hypothetical protein